MAKVSLHRAIRNDDLVNIKKVALPEYWPCIPGIPKKTDVPGSDRLKCGCVSGTYRISDHKDGRKAPQVTRRVSKLRIHAM